MKIDGAIFDADGTLLDSMFLWETVGDNYLRSLGICPEKNLRRIIETMSLEEMAEYFQRSYQIDRSVPEVIAGIDKLIEEDYGHHIKLKPGVRTLLDTFKANHIKMYVATATTRYLIVSALKNNNILEYFEGVVSCSDINTNKHTPEVFLYALEKLGTPKESTYIFEDAPHAIASAKAAGFRVIAVYDKYACADEEYLKEYADRSDAM